MIICESEKCTGCGMCVDCCIVCAIEMKKVEHGFYYPTIDSEKCIDCGQCKRKCPANDTSIKGQKQLGIYSAWNKNKAKRSKATSGGIFSLLAEKILENDGLVAGVAWDDSFHTEHVLINSVDELCRLNGSKYVQSHTNLIYRQIKNTLDNGKSVLFSGTPCQNHALRLFLGKDYTDLYLIDLVCHGVPSEDIFDRYLNERSNNGSKIIKQIRLRHKKPYWDWSYVTIDFENSESYSELTTDDSYFTLFNVGYSLRKSCSQCKYANMKRFGDITLADFWGFTANSFKQSNYLRGVSLVMVNTYKGQKLFQIISNDIIYEETSEKKALKSNKSLQEPYFISEDKINAFWSDYDIGTSIDELRDKYTGKPFTIPKLLWLRRVKHMYWWLVKRNE
ncbi:MULTISPECIES: Coenzyme F420 hydrogenase/dehydrogenase, beta subunit C-terminal domain [Blautia]|uniref:Coenzyme F420 hydrogenase/dehydrogenase, beta subunit C-terminal domain n=1 Tax=Blautia TaxID=572511 RepID=UPI000BA4C025|nr:MULTISPECIES: Coenzyme F420 hydrogenase/dehydrogenase, beta subunit C-terminal domain [Blautia]